jgi:hypothetical protein
MEHLQLSSFIDNERRIEAEHSTALRTCRALFAFIRGVLVALQIDVDDSQAAEVTHQVSTLKSYRGKWPRAAVNAHELHIFIRSLPYEIN